MSPKYTTVPDLNLRRLICDIGHRFWIVPAKTIGMIRPLEEETRSARRTGELFLSTMQPRSGGRVAFQSARHEIILFSAWATRHHLLRSRTDEASAAPQHQPFRRCQASLYFSYFALRACGVRSTSDWLFVALIGRMYHVSVGITYAAIMSMSFGEYGSPLESR